MRSCHYTIVSRQVHDRAFDWLQGALRLRDHGPKCTAQVVLAVLFWAAATMTSLAAACATLTDAPSDQAVRNALLATLPDIARLQCCLNRALAGGLPQILLRRSQYVAIDLTLLPYYGKPESDAEELYRGQRKAGTSQFHAYATAFIIFQGCRYTLGLRLVHHSDPWQDVVRDLLRQVRKSGVKVRCLLLDRGFYSVGVIRYLQAARYPFLMPAIRRGRKPEHPKGASGTWAFTTRKRSGWARYTLEERNDRRRATVTIAVCCHKLPERTRSGRAVRQRDVVWLYALWGFKPSSLAWVRETYRKRFGIESSYRQLNQSRIRTSSRSPLMRLLFVGVALVLRNVYVWLHWEVLAKKRRGKRRVDLNQLPLRAMLHWLLRVVEEFLGVNESVSSERPFLA
ncbi:MAG: transposase [SAR324 cluster bacterium]